MSFILGNIAQNYETTTKANRRHNFNCSLTNQLSEYAVRLKAYAGKSKTTFGYFFSFDVTLCNVHIEYGRKNLSPISSVHIMFAFVVSP